jgi:hypothetical protein
MIRRDIFKQPGNENSEQAGKPVNQSRIFNDFRYPEPEGNDAE